jgi:hypothetical protein
MTMKREKLLAASASLLSFAALTSACSCSSVSAPDGGGGSGGADGSGGSGGSGGAGTGGMGTGGADCPPAAVFDFVAWPSEGGAGGELGAGGEAAAASGPGFFCNPGVCLGAYLPIRDRFPLAFAFTNVGSAGDGTAASSHPSREHDVVISTPDPTRICAKGSDGAALNLALSAGMPADTLGEAFPVWRTVSWKDLGITQLRFTIETPPTSGVAVGIFTFAPLICDSGPTGYASAEVDGNPLVLDTNGATVTLSLASDFGVALDPSLLGELNFQVGEGEYDYCIKDLEFLNENGGRATR